MSKTVKTAEGQIYTLINNAVAAALAAGEFTETGDFTFKVEVPADKKNGDFSANAAFMLAKSQHKPPRAVADAIIARLELSDTYFSKCEAAGAGFINFFFGAQYYADILLDIEREGDSYGSSDYGEGKRVLVEFVSANPTGPMHIGNARGGALGDCLASVLTKAGYYTEREFYVNDAGNQVEKFSLSLELRYREVCGEQIEMPEDSYHGDDIIAHAKEFHALYGDSYINKPEQERRQALCSFALPKNIDGLEKDLLSYRIKYDTWFRESTLHKSGEVTRVLKLLTDSGFTYESEGATWFRATDFGCDKDFVLIRSNGIPTYIVPDIAYHYNKLKVRNFDTAIDILGADHHGYVPRLKATLQALGIDPARLNVILMQMVRLVRNGETIKASKRSGKAITLVTLLDEVPIDAARFFFNYREANSHFDFDLDLAVEQSSQNPVYYCQYAHARICSIFKKLADDGVTASHPQREELMLLTSDEERSLITHLSHLTDEVISAAKLLDPTKMTHYAIELAADFHKFYNAQRVLDDNESLRNARLFLCGCVRDTMKIILNMMKIDAPEQM